ncbi:hypothetical protein C095_07480 [Fusobacterium necrophorum subsp. funduliforme B35]|uniref:Uncharacterized protein n=1 Tax=Fusobacterium necrophorum subsp. funduliforme B35 TaxID=1226633 RepID=A0A0B4FNR4_9FUSO|nr:hypothetical protein C095_07480 [Fusobacterium necrophorum subsp. funduliforme B35]
MKKKACDFGYKIRERLKFCSYFLDFPKIEIKVLFLIFINNLLSVGEIFNDFSGVSEIEKTVFKMAEIKEKSLNLIVWLFSFRRN